MPRAWRAAVILSMLLLAALTAEVIQLGVAHQQSQERAIVINGQRIHGVSLALVAVENQVQVLEKEVAALMAGGTRAHPVSATPATAPAAAGVVPGTPVPHMHKVAATPRPTSTLAARPTSTARPRPSSTPAPTAKVRPTLPALPTPSPVIDCLLPYPQISCLL